MNSAKMKALMCCRACSPNWGSEPGMGWNFAYAVSSFCEVHVIVAGGHREKLESYCAEHKDTTKNLHFHYIDDIPPLGRWLQVVQKHLPTLFYYFQYGKWLRRATQLAVELDRTEDFDIVHQVTLAGFRMPGYLWRVRKPLLWGPIGGVDNAPYRFLISLRLIDIIGYTLRNVINSWQSRFGYAARCFAPKASYILASTCAGEQVVQKCWKRPGEYMCEIGTADGMEAKVFPALHHSGEPLRLCWVGIMNNQRKNLPMLFKSLMHCESSVEVCVIGGGQLKERWEKLSQSLPNRHKVVFTGAVSRERVFEEMSRSHVFCITSVRDDTSSVLLEAMQHGLPVIAPDSCGFSGVITEECGIKVAVDWPSRFARAYGRELNRLASDEALRQRLSRGALRRAEDFSWRSKTARLKEIYEAVVAGERP